MALTAMIVTYFDKPTITSVIFLYTDSSLIISMLLFTCEIKIANIALDVHLSDPETDQQWWQYLKPISKRRFKSRETSVKRNGLSQNI